MKINRNMAAVTANTHLLRTENRLQKSIAKLSSGYKINSAGENPAGMAISNKMKAQIDALDQANANANDGVSVLQIADGALNEVANMLQRIRELSVQAASDTNTFEDKQSIQQEIDELKKEVNRISTDTEYNTKVLLDGSSDARVYSNDVKRVNISDNVAAGKYEINVTATATAATKEYTIPAAFVNGSVEVNGMSFNVRDDMTVDEFLDELGVAVDNSGSSLEVAADKSTFKISTDITGSDAKLNIKFSKDLYEAFGGTVAAGDDNEFFTDKEVGKNAEVSLSEGFGTNATYNVEGDRVYVRDNNGFTMDFLINSDILDNATEATATIEVTQIGTMKIQVGANQYQEMAVRIPEISTESLYIDTVDVTAYGGADRAIATLDDAIEKLSSVRSRIGAFQNRLDYANNSLAETHEDMTAAYSRILDTDMAQEMSEYAQQNILDQAAISVLSQANDLPQQVLSLLSR